MEVRALRDGCINEILVKVGYLITYGTPLFYIEQKNGKEVRMISHDEGIVNQIHVQEGQMFNMDEPLIQLDLDKRNSKEDYNKSKRKERMGSFKPESSSPSNKVDVESESISREDEENLSKKMKVSIPDKPID